MSGLELPSNKCELEYCKPKPFLNRFQMMQDIQLAILGGGAEVEFTTKGTLKHVKDEIPSYFRFVSGGNTVGCLLISLLLEVTDSYSHFLSWRERENGEPGAKPPENF